MNKLEEIIVNQIIEIPKHMIGLFIKIIILTYFILICLIVNKKINFLNIIKILKKNLLKKISAKGIKNIPKENGYIVISNHVSFEDPLILSEIFNNLHFVAEYGNIAKLFYRDVPGLIYYDKSKDIIKAGNIVKQKILENVKNKINVGVFPEGEFCLPNQLNSFKKGLFYLSWENNIPFVPVLLLVKKSSKIVYTLTYSSNKISVKIFKSILPSQFNNFDEFYSHIYNLMNSCYKNYVKGKKEFDVYF
jgi:1-acyl-sn-glycerol-3-phosphate acyltransferase